MIVIGVGGMGSAALHHLARRGARALGLERFTVPHDQGSSHGQSRIIRLAYWEDPKYVPLLRRAYALWHELEAEAGEQLLITTGSIDEGRPDSRPVLGVRTVSADFDLACEELDAAALAARFPGYRLPEGMVAFYQPDGGFLLPERCILAHARAAASLGAVIHEGEQVTGWDVHGDRRGAHE